MKSIVNSFVNNWEILW